MRVDFYQLSKDPAEWVVPLIARNTLGAGERLVVVSEYEDQLDRIGQALWTRLADSFLANGRAGGPHDARQPILLDTTVSQEAPRPMARAFLRWPMAAGARARRSGCSCCSRPSVSTKPARHGAFWASARASSANTGVRTATGGARAPKFGALSCGVAPYRLGARATIPAFLTIQGNASWRLPAPFRSSSPTPPAAT
jgi:hypothetical protein